MYSVETYDGTRLASLVVSGPTPAFGDEIVVELEGRVRRFRVLIVEHRIGEPISGERESYAVAIVEEIGGAKRPVPTWVDDMINRRARGQS